MTCRLNDPGNISEVDSSIMTRRTALPCTLPISAADHAFRTAVVDSNELQGKEYF